MILELTQVGGLEGRRPFKNMFYCATLRPLCARSVAQENILGGGAAAPEPPPGMEKRWHDYK